MEKTEEKSRLMEAAAAAEQAGQTALRTGLVLEGGAMRGMFTCGVIDVLMENGVSFDGAAGISAGAVFGCNIKSKQIGRAIRYNKKYCRDPRYCSFRSLIRTGDLYGVEFCYHELPDVLDPFDRETFRSNPMAFYIGATDVRTGECVFHQCTDGGETDIKWMGASAAMPLVSKPVSVDGYVLLDGGISNSVPYRYMEKLGYNRSVIILTQPESYRKKRIKALPLVRRMVRQYPAVADALTVRHLMYNRQMQEIGERQRAGTAFVIRPPEPLGISRTENDPEQLERVYRIGRREAEAALPDLKRFLSGD